MNGLLKNKWLGIVTLLLLLVNITMLVLLWRNHTRETDRMPGDRPGLQAFEYINQELKLSESQQQQYSVLRDEHRKTQRPVIDSMQEARKQFFDLLKDSTANDSLIQARNQQLQQLQAQVEMINFRHFQQLRSILNDEQRTKFDGLLHEILKRFGGKRPPHPGMPAAGDKPGPPPGMPENPPPQQPE